MECLILRRIFLAVSMLLVMSFSLACNRSPEVSKRRYLESGQSYAKKGKYLEARIQYRRAMQIDSNYVEAYYQLAQVNVNLDQWGEAFSALQRAVELDANRLDARLNLGQLYLAAHQFDQAKKHIK